MSALRTWELTQSYELVPSFAEILSEISAVIKTTCLHQTKLMIILQDNNNNLFYLTSVSINTGTIGQVSWEQANTTHILYVI